MRRSSLISLDGQGALACGDLGWVSPEARAAMSEHFKEAFEVVFHSFTPFYDEFCDAF